MFDQEQSALRAYLALLEVGDQALCAQVDPEMWFPEKGGSSAAAKTLCFACPIREECLTYACAAGEFGVWGGMSDNERKSIGGRPARVRTYGGPQPLPTGPEPLYIDVAGCYTPKNGKRPAAERAA